MLTNFNIQLVDTFHVRYSLVCAVSNISMLWSIFFPPYQHPIPMMPSECHNQKYKIISKISISIIQLLTIYHNCLDHFRQKPLCYNSSVPLKFQSIDLTIFSPLFCLYIFDFLLSRVYSMVQIEAIPLHMVLTLLLFDPFLFIFALQQLEVNPKIHLLLHT